MPLAHKRSCTAGLFLIVFICFTIRSAYCRPPQIDNNNYLFELRSHLGSYMAGRIALGANDVSQSVAFYRQALKKSPSHPLILSRVFLGEAMHGNLTEADRIAQRLVKISSDNHLAQLWLGASEFRAGRYFDADQYFELAGQDPISRLTSKLSRAWAALAQNKKKQALKYLVPTVHESWSSYYLQYHRALISDLSRRPKVSRKLYSEIFNMDSRTPRVAAAYLRHAIHRGKYALAGQIARRHIKDSANGGHASVLALFEDVKAGNSVPLMIGSPQDGLAEAFYGIGEALIGEGGLELGTIYLQLALSVKPDFPFALLALANAHEVSRNYQHAIEVYDSIRSGTSLEMEIAIRKAVNLDALNETNRAKQILDAVITSYPESTRPLEAIGNMLRTSKRYQEAVYYYSRIIKLIRKPEKRHWIYWYARGTSYERIEQWSKAESDLLKAMRLDPNQALVLNYLGYSWVDQNVNLNRGLKLIERAVELKPNDGYIIDSLGWAHFRLGNYKEAVLHLERAVELKPEDPILNDHLGDALWQVSRLREARYQWELALSLRPEKLEAVKIRKKLASSLLPQAILKTSVRDGSVELYSTQVRKPTIDEKKYDSQRSK
ncbi:MAG: tetratricopeptide repeat protein [Hyphomicrobiaceae bacterium]|nr:tetratricopeptide repeat protein [Hyphomicrobiaceae bacterium]